MRRCPSPRLSWAALVFAAVIVGAAPVYGAEPKSPESTHWSFVRPSRPPLPAVQDTAWPKSDIDHFVLAALEKRGMRPSPPAAPTILARRVYLDLIGLPPSPQEIDQYLEDSSPGAYERLVDRLLASPQFGVRWARPWLDCARYADSHGFQRDDFRDLWPYRDWVVAAFNEDMPFDQFTIEQLAGDLLPHATESQRIASGFNRNAPTNVEAGSEPEETRVNQVFDRVNTLGMTWLGITLECCQCHDHKFDALTMDDYYGLFAFFNNTALEADRSNPKVPGSIRFLGPEMALADPQNTLARTQLKSQIEANARELMQLEQQAAETNAQWEADLLNTVGQSPQEHGLEFAEFDSLGGATHQTLADKSILLSGEAPDHDTYTATTTTTLAGIRAFKLETLTDPSLPGKGPGRGDAERPNFVLNTFSLSVTSGSGGNPTEVSFVRATADFSQKGFDVAGAIDKNAKSAWAINPKFHESHWAVFVTDRPIGEGSPVVLTFRLEQNYGAARTIGRLRLSAVTGNVDSQSFPAEVVEVIRISPEKRSAAQKKVVATFRAKLNPAYNSCQKTKTRLEAEYEKLKPPSSLVMQELEQPRESTIFVRGDFRSPGRSIKPATPAVLHPFANSSRAPPERPTRLDLAAWLVRPENPLTARVVANRWWAELFGHGLVTTPEDFGVQGDLPTHPELLDWLALEYAEQGWSLKRLLKTIVMSATYGQAARMTPELLAEDDRNLLYARAPRYRLDAEAIRDNALAIAGLLSPNQGGQSIRPFQPEGIWIKVGGQRYEYVISPGEQQFRRGLYVIWKRGAPYPSFINFDANNRMTCRVKRARSNTPLQALTLLNDPVYVEAAAGMARRIVEEKPHANVDERVEYAFRLALARRPVATELLALRQLYEQQFDAGRQSPEAAKSLAVRFRPPSGVGAEEFAAWYAVATALLNLDETITKG